MASWYSPVNVRGGGPAKCLMMPKITPETPIAAMVYANTLVFSPFGGSARGPCGPKAIQYAAGRVSHVRLSSNPISAVK